MMVKFNYALGSAASAWLLLVLVILSELSEQFKNLLVIAFWHHWLGKIVLVTLCFLVSGFALKDRNYVAKLSADKLAWYSVLISLLIIFLFFVIDFFR